MRSVMKQFLWSFDWTFNMNIRNNEVSGITALIFFNVIESVSLKKGSQHLLHKTNQLGDEV